MCCQAIKSSKAHIQWTITLKMVDQEKCDFNVVFTMILFGLNVYVWKVIKLIFLGQLEMGSPDICLCFETYKYSDSKFINVSNNLSALRLIVKAT